MLRQKNNLSNKMNNQSIKEVQKKKKISLEYKLKDMEDCDLNERELKIVVLKKNSVVQQNEYLTKETKTIKKKFWS